MEKMDVFQKVQENLGTAESMKESIKSSMAQLTKQWEDFGACMATTKSLLHEGLHELGTKQQDLSAARKQVSEQREILDLYSKNLDEKYEKLVKKEDDLFVTQENRFLDLIEIKEKHVKEFKIRESLIVEKEKCIEMRENEVVLKEKILEERRQEVELKDQKLKRKIEEVRAKEKAIEDKKRENEFRERGLGEREKKVDVREKEVENGTKEVELIQMELGLIKRELEIKEEEVESTRQSYEKYVKELESREKQLNSREEKLDSDKKFTMVFLDQFHSEKEQYQLEKECTEKELDMKRQELEKRIEDVKLREKELELNEKRCSVMLNSAEANQTVEYAAYHERTTNFIYNSNMDGKELQMYLNEHTKEIDSMGNDICKALKFSHNPAKLVLDAIKGFYPSHLKNGGIEFEESFAKKSCILLLEHLIKLSPNIQPPVREEAMKLASDWKEKMTVKDSLESLGFLQLLAAYDLTSAFDADEIMSLLETASHHQQSTELYRQLGMDERTTALKNNLLINYRCLESQYSLEKHKQKVKQLSSSHEPKKPKKVHVNEMSCETESNVGPPEPMAVILANMEGTDLLFFLKDHVEELELLCSHIFSALQMSNDSAQLVLDAIKGLYYSQKKKEADIETSIKWKSCIILLEQMMFLLPDIKAETIEEASKLAFDLQERMQAETNPLIVFGFLLFIGTYGVASYFDSDKLLSFYEIASRIGHLPALCRAHEISKRIYENSLPHSLAEVLQSSLKRVMMHNRKASTDMVPGQDAKSLCHAVVPKRKECISVSSEIPTIICKASDPAKLVLDALMSCYNSYRKKCQISKLVAECFFQLLEQLMRVSPEIKPDVKDKATEFALDWKAKRDLHLSESSISSWESLGLLQLVVTYNISSSFKSEELLDLLEAIHEADKAAALIRNLELADKMPGFIRNLISKKLLLLALRYIYEFKLVDMFPPIPLMENHILHCKQQANKICDDNQNSTEVQDQAVLGEISALEATLQCIKDYGLESEYPPNKVKEQIQELQRHKANLKSSIPACTFMTKLQKLAAERRKVAPMLVELQHKDGKNSSAPALIAALPPVYRKKRSIRIPVAELEQGDEKNQSDLARRGEWQQRDMMKRSADEVGISNEGQPSMNKSPRYS